MVVAHQQLIGEDGPEHLRSVVVEATMPDPIFQFEQRLEPLIEWLRRLAASGIQAPSLPTLVVLDPLATKFSAVGAASVGVARSFLGSHVIAGVRWTDEATAGALTLFVAFDPFPQVIGVVAAVHQHRLGSRGQLIDLGGESAGFTGAGRIDRSQQREHYRSWRGGHDHLVAIALEPAVVLRVTPGAIRIHARGNVARLTIPRVPRRSLRFDQTLVCGDEGRIDDAFRHRLLALQANGDAVDVMRPAVAAIVAGTRRKLRAIQPGGDVVASPAQVAELLRFGLFLVQ